MKAEINQKRNEQEIEFPCLMIFEKTQSIYLITGEGGFDGQYSGICIFKGTSDDIIGEYVDYWAKSSLTPFSGTITLSND